MSEEQQSLSRAELLKLGGAGAAGLSLYLSGGSALAARMRSAAAGSTEGVTLNWLTWFDHYFPQQLRYEEEDGDRFPHEAGTVRLADLHDDPHHRVPVRHRRDGRALGAQGTQGRARRSRSTSRRSRVEAVVLRRSQHRHLEGRLQHDGVSERVVDHPGLLQPEVTSRPSPTRTTPCSTRSTRARSSTRTRPRR